MSNFMFCIFYHKKFRPKYNNLKTQMTDYVMSAENISIEEIENIVQKYSPETKVEFFENLENERMLTNGTRAYTKMPTALFANNNNIQIEARPKTIYLKFSQELDKKDKTVLLDAILHECTHVFQEESKDKVSTTEFLNNYLKKSANIDKTLNTVGSLPNLFVVYENNAKELLRFFDEDFDILPSELKNKNVSLDMVCQKKFGDNTINVLSTLIVNVLRTYQVDDPNLVLDYFILKSDFEEEAYKNALESSRELLGLKNKTTFDLRLEVYKKMSEAAKKVKGQIKRLK